MHIVGAGFVLHGGGGEEEPDSGLEIHNSTLVDVQSTRTDFGLEEGQVAMKKLALIYNVIVRLDGDVPCISKMHISMLAYGTMSSEFQCTRISTFLNSAISTTSFPRQDPLPGLECRASSLEAIGSITLSTVAESLASCGPAFPLFDGKTDELYRLFSSFSDS